VSAQNGEEECCHQCNSLEGDHHSGHGSQLDLLCFWLDFVGGDDMAEEFIGRPQASE
jgi:hypothetical protein